MGFAEAVARHNGIRSILVGDEKANRLAQTFYMGRGYRGFRSNELRKILMDSASVCL